MRLSISMSLDSAEMRVEGGKDAGEPDGYAVAVVLRRLAGEFEDRGVRGMDGRTFGTLSYRGRKEGLVTFTEDDTDREEARERRRGNEEGDGEEGGDASAQEA